jgi:hypothetical protein
MKMKMKRLPLAVVQALSISLGVTALTVAVGPTAMAQSSASGNIYGQATANASIVAESVETGAKRRTTADATGKFTFNALPTGPYKVQIVSGDKVVSTRQVEVLIGQGVEANFATGTQSVESVQVVARRQTIDVSSSNSGATFTAKELEKLPVSPNVASIIQLAPNTTRGDSRYGGVNAPSFGGSSASENAYYINGFPVTNVLYQVGFSQLPFGAISQIQLLSGGYGAEFGRSTGGVVNIQTKSGTNEWEAGIAADWSPASLRGKEKNLYFANTGAYPSTDKQLKQLQSRNQVETLRYNAYVGGPIIKDKLFFYINAEANRNHREFVSNASTTGATTGVNGNSASSGWTVVSTDIPRYVGKIDWNITDNHHLEYTQIRDQVNEDRKVYGFNYNTQTQGTTQSSGISYVNSGPTPVAAASGADLKIAKYTGYITENIILSGLYGTSKTPHSDTPTGYNSSLFQTSSTAADHFGSLVYNNPQSVPGSLLVPGAQDKQKAFRLDLEWKISNHTARVGIDNNKIDSVTGSATAGGGQWVYGNSAGNPSAIPTGATISPAATGTAPGLAGFFVQKILSSSFTTPSVKQSAQFIEDKWQLTKNVLLTIGLRNEQFTNYNEVGVAYLSQRHQLAPRFAAAWDTFGDGTMKVFGTLGRYHLQIPTNVAVRGAGPSLNTNQYFGYSGVDPVTGAPTGLVQMSPPLSANNEFGQPKDPRQVAAQNLKSHYQDEMTLGFEKAWSPSINVGSKATYRKLGSTIDDTCDGRPFLAYAQAHGINSSNYGFQCALFNPGMDNKFLVDFTGSGSTSVALTEVNLPASVMGPKAKRTYTALDFFLEHPFRNGWYGKASYTWSASKGNTEGQLLSDIGQADVSTTQTFDHPEIGLNSYGRLPNDRRHQLKFYGFYEVTSQWTAGTNLLVASGRPKNCKGSLPASYWANNGSGDGSLSPQLYGSAFFFCNGVATPRGSLGTLPWDTRVDLNLTYRPASVKGLAFKGTVLNVFNKQTVATIEERLNNTSGTVRNTSGSTLAFTSPISFIFSVAYDFKP